MTNPLWNSGRSSRMKVETRLVSLKQEVCHQNCDNNNRKKNWKIVFRSGTTTGNMESNTTCHMDCGLFVERSEV